MEGTQEQSGENRAAAPKPEGQVINLVVKDQNGGEVHFRVKSHTKLDKVINAYCQKKSLDVNQVRFLFDGTRLNANNTPQDMGMEDGDSIDCVVEQLGGW